MAGRYRRVQIHDDDRSSHARGASVDSDDATEREADRPLGRLHRRLGNQAVQRLAREGAIQPSLSVTAPDDATEREADRVADAVVDDGQRPAPDGSPGAVAVSRRVDDRIQRQASAAGSGGQGGMTMATEDDWEASEDDESDDQYVGGYTGVGTGGVGGMTVAVGDDAQESIENVPWHETGNVRGDPPVRDLVDPPNKHIVEDEATYGTRRDVARDFLERQERRTEGMKDDSGTVEDYRYWFARLYQEVTKNEILHAERGNFYYPSFVLASVNYFEQIYHDNLEAFDEAGREAEEHWQDAFETAAEQERRLEDAWIPSITTYVDSVMKSMIASVKAHLRFDLPRAEAWVFEHYYSGYENASIDDFRPDFLAMSNVFKNAASFMNRHIYQKKWIPADQAPPMLEQFMMEQYDLNLASERADTWERARLLVEEERAGEDPYEMGASGLEGDATASDTTRGLESLEGTIEPRMERSAPGYSAASVRDLVDQSSRAELGEFAPTRRIRMVESLLGWRSDGEYVLEILHASRGNDLVDVVNGLQAHTMLRQLSGDSFSEATEFLKNHYWQAVDHWTALFNVKQCLDGPTDNWQENLVLDLLEVRDDDRELIESLGASPQYSDYDGEDDFDRGLGVLELEFDGRQDTELENRYGHSSQAWF